MRTWQCLRGVGKGEKKETGNMGANTVDRRKQEIGDTWILLYKGRSSGKKFMAQAANKLGLFISWSEGKRYGRVEERVPGFEIIWSGDDVSGGTDRILPFCIDRAGSGGGNELGTSVDGVPFPFRFPSLPLATTCCSSDSAYFGGAPNVSYLGRKSLSLKAPSWSTSAPAEVNLRPSMSTSCERICLVWLAAGNGTAMK